jgi:ABC-type phosphate transport system substrate-binding protein
MKKLWYALLIASSATIFMARAHAQAIVIVNLGVKAADVSKGDLKDVFTGAASSLKDGSHVTPVLLKEGSAHEEFLTAYVGKNDTAFRAGWRSLVFSGQASMPKSLDSEAAMVEYVAHTPGAIGYVAKSAPHDGVKVLAVK